MNLKQEFLNVLPAETNIGSLSNLSEDQQDKYIAGSVLDARSIVASYLRDNHKNGDLVRITGLQLDGSEFETLCDERDRPVYLTKRKFGFYEVDFD